MGIYTEAVQKLYVAYFSRPADAAGLTYWEGVVNAAEGDTAAVSAAFAASQEYKDTFAGMSEYQVINTIYMNLFGRPAEPAALTFWGQNLIANKFTIDNAVTAIAEGAVGTDLAAYNNKVTAATAFTAALDTSAEILGYNGAAANAVAKNWIAGITTDASLEAAIAPAVLAASIDDVVGAGNEGETFVLTQGQDTLTGTAGNDNFVVNAFNPTTGAEASNFNSFDTINGGAGKDSLTINVVDSSATGATANLNAAIGTVTNVETIVLDQTAADAALLPASLNASQFVGATSITQVGKATAVTNLAASTTAGFTGVTTPISVTAAGASAAIALTNVLETATVTVNGASLSAVTVAGSLVDSDDVGTAVGALGLIVEAGKDVQTVSVNSALATNLVVNERTGSTKMVTTVDASTSTGIISFTGDAATTTIVTGAAADAVTLATATSKATSTAAAVNASASTNASADTITVNTTGDGATTVDAGAGDDTVQITARSSGKLTANLGDGADVFTSAVPVLAGDSIDAGAGIDTLALSLVGSANIGAFSNFDVFDAVGLGKTLDVDILATKNTVTEFIASGDVVAGATLTNVAAGVGVRVTGTMATALDPAVVPVLTVNQKTAGALTVTVDADETATANADPELVKAAIATNATSVNAVFDTSYLADTAAEALLGVTEDNFTTLTLTADSATSVAVVSGGENATNAITINGSDALTSVTVTGAQNLMIAGIAGATKVATVDASAATGGISVSTEVLANGGTIRLGTGVDKVSVGASSAGVNAEKIVGMEKAAAVAVSTAAADATAAAAAQADADVLVFAPAAVVANANTAVTTGSIAKGILSFTGAGPSDLQSAINIANNAADGANEVVLFEYLGNSYVFMQGGTSADATGDLLVQLVGVTGATNLAEIGDTGAFFLV